MRLQEKDIYLRPMTEEDTDLIVKWRNKDFVRKNFIYRKSFTREGHLHWIETMVKTGKVVQFIICTEDDKPVGSVYLRDIDTNHRKAEYGIFIGEESALSRGYGTQAAKLMIRYAFDELKLHKLMLRVLAGNERARRSYEKAGFVQEAYLKDDVYLEEGYHDVILMALINPEK
ncbi:MAG: UDP-4-amino-4,6-dideoxy-N-acetyl-beta-L-altrosamine N-acetyltransferase [Suilimivivens sp.]